MPPNKERESDFNTQGKTVWKKLLSNDDPIKPFDRNIYFQNQDLRAWENIEDIEVVLRNHRWAFNLLPLASIDVESKTAVLAVDPTYQPSHKRAFWIENAIDHLDEPGAVSYTHLRAHETVLDLVCRLLLEKKKI